MDKLNTGGRLHSEVMQPIQICWKRVQDEKKDIKERSHQPNCCVLLHTVMTPRRN